MWLINTTTLHLHLFTQDISKIPGYAILSHRWEQQEVSFRQFSEADMVKWDGDDSDKAEELEAFPHLSELIQYRRKKLFSKKGFRKIETFCERAKTKGYDWGWVDTCCIDKSSSAELQEAINSMFDWYHCSKICIVFLSDVTVQHSFTETLKQFRASVWFKRGWTLQELIAPSALDFVDCKWQSFGNRESLLNDISLASGIPKEAFGRTELKSVLNHSLFRNMNETITSLAFYSVAERMAWAAERETTRPEDRAYCLFGLFQVNLPLLYGEGAYSAFYRLQLEILESSEDETVLISRDKSMEDLQGSIGLLAHEPSHFLQSKVTMHRRDSPQYVDRSFYEPTTLGLRIETVLLNNVAEPDAVKDFREMFPEYDVYFMPLRCSLHHRDTGEVILIALARASDKKANKYFRVGPWFAAPCDIKKLFAEGPKQEIYVSLTNSQAWARFLDLDVLASRTY